jgi:hypothetical protein
VVAGKAVPCDMQLLFRIAARVACFRDEAGGSCVRGDNLSFNSQQELSRSLAPHQPHIASCVVRLCAGHSGIYLTGLQPQTGRIRRDVSAHVSLADVLRSPERGSLGLPV